MTEPQEITWPRWLEEHHRNRKGLAYYLVPCPRCKAPALQYCHSNGDGRTGGREPLCEVRVKMWEALGKPSGYHEIPTMDNLLYKMVEASLDEEA